MKLFPLSTTGDFNGDHQQDVVITSWQGSFWYYSQETASWNRGAYVRPDLPLGQ